MHTLTYVQICANDGFWMTVWQIKLRFGITKKYYELHRVLKVLEPFYIKTATAVLELEICSQKGKNSFVCEEMINFFVSKGK